MRLLLDTRIALWWLDGHPRLSVETRTLVDAATDVFLSHASLWEMAVKQSAGRLRVDLPTFAKQADATGFRWLDVRPEHLFAVARLAEIPGHRDPFERLLVAQSLTEPLILVTPNRALERYGATVRAV